MNRIANDGDVRRYTFGISAAIAALALASACATGGQNASTPVASGPTPQPTPTPRDFTKTVIKSTELGKNTYMLEGEGGNITVAVGKDGVIVVDSQFAPLYDRIKVVIEGLTKRKVKYLVNTHFHGDHTGGNASFAKDGATVVAHENVKSRLASGSTNASSGAKIPPAAAEALPKQTYKTEGIKLKVKGRTAELHHPGPAHTDGDTYVYFKDANVLATGDLVFIGRYPVLDYLNGGTIEGMIATTDRFIKMTNDKTKIVPGHGPLIDKAALVGYREMLVTSRDRIQKLVAEGKSEQEVAAAKPLADLDKVWGGNELAAKGWLRMVYHSVKKN